MASSENDYTTMLQPDKAPQKRDGATPLRKRSNVTTPGETEEQMAATAPAAEAAATEELNENDTNDAGDIIDSGNNYTAAENDHDTNATL